MNIFRSTSRHQENFDSRTLGLARRKKLALIASLMALSCLAFSPVLAGDYIHAKVPAAPIHLTSLSIVISPEGFHLGIGAPFYGRAYVRPHVYVQPAPHRHWNYSRYYGNHHHYAVPQRFNNRGHGWKNNGPRGNFRGNNGRGNGGHRGGYR